MTAPNISTITDSLERSLQNCSLNHRSNSDRAARISASSDDASENHNLTNSDTTLELNSHVSLPYHWEQCLDLKTGEIYYINWRNGMKAKENPRTSVEYSGSYFYSEDESSNYDSEESSSDSSLPPCSGSSTREHHNDPDHDDKDQVLVVAGCKTCLMYFMVPKQVEDCPKCTGQLLHFDRSDNDFP